MIACFFDAFRNKAHPFSWPLRKTANSEFTVMLFVYFIREREFAVLELFLSNDYCLLRHEGHLCGNQKLWILNPRKMKANTILNGLLAVVINCEVPLMSDLWTFAWANETDRADLKVLCLSWYDFAAAIIFAA